MVEDTHELALDALIRTIAQTGTVRGDGNVIRDQLSPLVSAIMDIGSDYPASWDAAMATLREAAGRTSSDS